MKDIQYVMIIAQFIDKVFTIMHASQPNVINIGRMTVHT